MAVKSKLKVERSSYFTVSIVILVIVVIISYLGIKISQVLYNDKSLIDPSWLDYIPYVGSYFKRNHESGKLTVLQKDFYTKLWSLIYADTQFVIAMMYNFVIYLCEILSSILALVAVIVLVCICLSVSLYKDSTARRKTRKQKEAKKAKDRNGLSAKNGHVCCDHQQDILTNKKLWWKWLTLIVFLAMLLSIPWEFFRMYQSVVAEKVAQMQAGIPAECLPDQSVFQSVKSWLRWYLSWAPDPCLVYHKALIVDPLWQVSPLMVLSSAFSHCIVYPIEVLSGGLGRALRSFFNEIPAPWQPFMLVIIVFLVVLTLIMAFGYRLHLPMLFKFEPKTPVYLRHKTHADKHITREKQNLQFTAADSQQSIQCSQDSMDSQDTQYSRESQYTQESQYSQESQ